jgi:hypothetical protein
MCCTAVAPGCRPALQHGCTALRRPADASRDQALPPLLLSTWAERRTCRRARLAQHAVVDPEQRALTHHGLWQAHRLGQLCSRDALALLELQQHGGVHRRDLRQGRRGGGGDGGGGGQGGQGEQGEQLRSNAANILLESESVRAVRLQC